MDPFVGEVRTFGFPFAPRGWAVCNGAQLPIAQYTAVYALLGTAYGGDGKSTFGIPNLQGRAPMHAGGSYPRGASGGATTVTLQVTQVPSHTHTMQATTEDGTSAAVQPNTSLAGSTGGRLYQTNTSANLVSLTSGAVQSVGAGEAHNNMQPYLTCNFCLALVGVYPQRS